jgi:DNA sulfur modification protein DndB
MIQKTTNTPIVLPCLKGKMGDWYYYVALLSFNEVAKRIKLPSEIDTYYKEKEDLRLGDWIQRDLEKNRTKNIVDYLKNQPQHFFNSLILGIYEGNPSWQDLNISTNKMYENLDESKMEYLSRTFGLLTLEGSEDIFPIDGQHRAIAIREAVKANSKIGQEEITVIFVGHKTDQEGKIRTRRLFSTLNKYAKPVSQSEIIALSEDNNCAVITRELVDNFPLLKNKILTIKNRSISPENTTHFSNILVLYDIVETILTSKSIVGLKTRGKEKNQFTTNRTTELEIKKDVKILKVLFSEIIHAIPSLKSYFSGDSINRKLKTTSLLFRPIGQNIFFDVLKVGISNSKKKIILDYFLKETFNLSNPVWNKIFWDAETETIITDKSRQRFATILILEKLGFEISKTKKDNEIFESFKINKKEL